MKTRRVTAGSGGEGSRQEESAGVGDGVGRREAEKEPMSPCSCSNFWTKARRNYEMLKGGSGVGIFIRLCFLTWSKASDGGGL